MACPWCQSTDILLLKCPGGGFCGNCKKKWYICKHNVVCEGHVKNPCMCKKYQQEIKKDLDRRNKFFVHNKADRNPKKK